MDAPEGSRLLLGVWLLQELHWFLPSPLGAPATTLGGFTSESFYH